MWLSIIIPVYNAGDYVDKCLLSILSQPSAGFEVIAIDDASTDNSWQKMENYRKSDPRLVTVRHSENKLAGHARNAGIQMARGDYIWFVDADDWINPGAIDLLYNEVRKQPQADIFSFGYCEHYSVNETTEAFIRIPRHRLGETKALRNFLQMKMGFTSMPFSYLFKNSFLRSRQLNFPVGCYFEDVYFMGKAFYYSSLVALIPRIIYNYNRLNHNSITLLPSPKKIMDLIEMYAALQQFLQKQTDGHDYQYLFAFRFLIYGLPRCYRMYFCLPGNERKNPLLKNKLIRLKKSKIMTRASLASAISFARSMTQADERLRSEFARNIHFIICIKYAFPLLRMASRYRELKCQLKEAIQAIPSIFHPLHTFNRMRD